MFDFRPNCTQLSAINHYLSSCPGLKSLRACFAKNSLALDKFDQWETDIKTKFVMG